MTSNGDYDKSRCKCRILGGKRKRTSKKLSPAPCTSISRSSEPGVKMGSGASGVSCILDGCAYSEMTNAFIEVVGAPVAVHGVRREPATILRAGDDGHTGPRHYRGLLCHIILPSVFPTTMPRDDVSEVPIEVDEPAAGETMPKKSNLPSTPPRVSIPETAVQTLHEVLDDNILTTSEDDRIQRRLGTIWYNVHKALSQEETKNTRLADEGQFLEGIIQLTC